MKPFDQLTPRQQFFRKNLVCLVMYGGFVLVLYWSGSKMIEIQREKDAEAQPRVETVDA